MSIFNRLRFNLIECFLFAEKIGTQQCRTVTNKHYDPKWRKQRAAKVYKMNLPDFEKISKEAADDSPEKLRSKMKRRGVQPPRTFQERDIVISSTASTFEPYVPPEGDGVASLISSEGAKQRFTELEKKGKSFYQVRKIRQFEPNFDTKKFAHEALEIYKDAHDVLQRLRTEEDRLHELITEKAFPEMVCGLEKKTVRWSFVESLEPPRTVHVRQTDLYSKDNVFGQVTVRFHTKQLLAIYDRFGRLMMGSEKLSKNVLEYCVFEKHLSDEYGLWRLHDKIVPDWMPSKNTVLRTIRRPNEDSPQSDKSADNSSASNDSSPSPPEHDPSQSQQAPVAVA